jgi:hypothetical protein
MLDLAPRRIIAFLYQPLVSTHNHSANCTHARMRHDSCRADEVLRVEILDCSQFWMPMLINCVVHCRWFGPVGSVTISRYTPPANTAFAVRGTWLWCVVLAGFIAART